jgi:hypothetical protein
MAEAVANSLNSRRFTFASAGMSAGPVDPQTIQFLAQGPSVAPGSKALDQSQLDLTWWSRDQQAQKALPQRPAKSLARLGAPTRWRSTRRGRAAYDQRLISPGHPRPGKPFWMTRP